MIWVGDRMLAIEVSDNLLGWTPGRSDETFHVSSWRHRKIIQFFRLVFSFFFFSNVLLIN